MREGSKTAAEISGNDGQMRLVMAEAKLFTDGPNSLFETGEGEDMPAYVYHLSENLESIKALISPDSNFTVPEHSLVNYDMNEHIRQTNV